MEQLLAELGNPEKKLPILHVAGTNGKGSVCAFTESILRSSGYKTGLYTSPHLVDFAERIQINGVQAEQSLINEGISRLRRLTSQWSAQDQPTYFELATALAFDLFSQAACDAVVLETGLGGRLDATNTSSKLASAVTPIAMDHTEWLGATLGEIAREKAGIMRRGIPTVIAPQEEEARESLTSYALSIGSPCQWISQPLGNELKIGLAGPHQRWNAALALALTEAGGFVIPRNAVVSGLANVVWPGRFQRLRGGSLILDGAHNLHAARSLVETWKEQFGDSRCRLIFGALADKDPQSMLNELECIASEISVVPVCSSRGADPGLFEVSSSIPFSVSGSLKEALGEMFQVRDGISAVSGRPVLVTGSLFLVGEVLALEAGGLVAPRSQ